MRIQLSQALRAYIPSSIAFTGAGGKTTAMFQLARELMAQKPVIVTASSHLGAWQISLADHHLVVEPSDNIEDLNQNPGITLFTGEYDGDRTKPLDEKNLSKLDQLCREYYLPLLIESDGSRQKPLKGWTVHEPPVPYFVNHVIQVAGLAGLGKPLNDEIAHRAEIFSRLSGLTIGEVITTGALLRALTHADGGQKNIPITARKTILLNQADTEELQSAAHGMADDLLSTFHSVVIASLAQKKIMAVHEPVAGIILAAGEAKRYGQTKQLLNWNGQPFVRAVAKTALEAGLTPVIVVVGANADQVQAGVDDLGVKVIINHDWKSGQASSIKEGVKAIFPAHSSRIENGAAIFLLADQPHITTSILRALMERHAESLHPIVAPMVLDRRANPVLFDRVTFPDLMKLEGDVGGRAIFHQHTVEYLPWHDDRLLLDVDTPEQYQRLISDDIL